MAHIKAGVRSGQEVQGKIPQEWGTDQLAAFLDLSSDNLLASYVHARQHYDDVARVDAAYVTFTDNLLNPDDLIAPMFFLQAHAAYRSAASLAMSCESAPAFMVMRGCLEHSLYGLYVNRKPDTFDLWLKREDSDETRQLVRNEFRISRLKDCLREADQTTADAADGLYGKTNRLRRTSERWSLERGVPDAPRGRPPRSAGAVHDGGPGDHHGHLEVRADRRV